MSPIEEYFNYYNKYSTAPDLTKNMRYRVANPDQSYSSYLTNKPDMTKYNNTILDMLGNWSGEDKRHKTILENRANDIMTSQSDASKTWASRYKKIDASGQPRNLQQVLSMGFGGVI